MTPILDVVEEHAATHSLLTRAEARDVRTRWRQIFAKPLFAATGKWRLLGYDWHTFSYDYAPALEGERALQAYREQKPAEVYILPDGANAPEVGLRASFVGKTLPDFGRVDVLVSPADLEWTMAFTHEFGWIGPYFATASEALEQAERQLARPQPRARPRPSRRR